MKTKTKTNVRASSKPKSKTKPKTKTKTKSKTKSKTIFKSKTSFKEAYTSKKRALIKFVNDSVNRELAVTGLTVVGIPLVCILILKMYRKSKESLTIAKSFFETKIKTPTSESEKRAKLFIMNFIQFIGDDDKRAEKFAELTIKLSQYEIKKFFSSIVTEFLADLDALKTLPPGQMNRAMAVNMVKYFTLGVTKLEKKKTNHFEGILGNRFFHWLSSFFTTKKALPASL